LEMCGEVINNLDKARLLLARVESERNYTTDRYILLLSDTIWRMDKLAGPFIVEYLKRMNHPNPKFQCYSHTTMHNNYLRYVRDRKATLRKISLLLTATRQEPRGQWLIKRRSVVHNLLLTVKTYVPTSTSTSDLVTECFSPISNIPEVIIVRRHCANRNEALD